MCSAVEARHVEWLVPWHSVADDPSQVEGMEQELSRELSAGRSLFGLQMRTLARRQDCDQVLFAVEDGTGRVAVVHLTWTGSAPEQRPLPDATVYPSIEARAVEGMGAHHSDFSAGARG
jgi:hypothetical protein